jgi:hypothetical protein
MNYLPLAFLGRLLLWLLLWLLLLLPLLRQPLLLFPVFAGSNVTLYHAVILDLLLREWSAPEFH